MSEHRPAKDIALSEEEEVHMRALLAELPLLEPESVPSPERALQAFRRLHEETPATPSGIPWWSALFRPSSFAWAGGFAVLCIFLLQSGMFTRDVLESKGRLHLSIDTELGLLIGTLRPGGTQIQRQLGAGDVCYASERLIFRYALAKRASAGYIYLLQWHRKAKFVYPVVLDKPSYAKPGRTYDIFRGKSYAFERERGSVSFLLLKSSSPLSPTFIKTLTKSKSLDVLLNHVRTHKAPRVFFDKVHLQVRTHR